MSSKKAKSYDRRWFDRQVADMVEIANEPGAHKRDAELAIELEEDCSRPSGQTARSVYAPIGSDLYHLAWSVMRQGAIAVLNGDKSAWTEVRRGFLYDVWRARARHTFVSADRCWDNDKTAAGLFDGREALAMCGAIATGDNDFAHGFGNHLLTNFERTQGGHKIFFYTMPFFPFTLKLYSVWVGKEIELRKDIRNPLGRYQAVFDNWNKPRNLADALRDICDLHCEEAKDKSGYPAFCYHPYNVFPVEVMAIRRIRTDLGLETPEIEHVLLDSPLVHPPKKIPTVKDPLLDMVAARLQRDFPNGGPF